MKSIMKSLMLVAAIGLTLNACKKDEKRAILSTAGANNTLTASATTFTLDSTQKTATAVTFKWDSVNYNVKAAVTYVLQIDKAADNFATPKGVTVGTNLYQYSYSVGDLNALALTLDSTVTGNMQVRILSYLQEGTNIYDSVYSNVVTVTVTPYIVVVPIMLTYLWVPGAYQGWLPGVAPQLASANAVAFQGFINLSPNAAAGSDSFKITIEADWNGTDYGEAGPFTTAGNITSGTMSSTGGNMGIPFGYYFMQANTTSLGFTATSVNSFVANGSATSNTAVPLTYDTVANVWYANSVALSAGTLSYITNPTAGDASTITFGQGTQSSYDVMMGGTAINVATAGTYDIKLVLSSPMKYTDTLTKH